MSPKPPPRLARRRPGGAGRWTVVLGLLVLIVAGAVGYRLWMGTERNPGRGTSWTVLQDLELEHRGDAEHDSPLLVSHPEDSPYIVLGLPTDDPQLPRTWILLNEHAIDHGAGPVKSVPANPRFRVECAYVDDLFAHQPVDPAAQTLLKRRCRR